MDALDAINALAAEFPDAETLAIRQAFDSEEAWELDRCRDQRMRLTSAVRSDVCERVLERIRYWITNPNEIGDQTGIDTDGVYCSMQSMMGLVRLVRFVGSTRQSCIWATLFGLWLKTTSKLRRQSA